MSGTLLFDVRRSAPFRVEVRVQVKRDREVVVGFGARRAASVQDILEREGTEVFEQEHD